jgi:hypothetical protein
LCPGVRKIHGEIVGTPGDSIRYRYSTKHFAVPPVRIKPEERRGSSLPLFVERPHPKSAAAVASSVVESDTRRSRCWAEQSANLAGAKIDRSKARSQRRDAATKPAQSQATNILRHRPSLTCARGGIEAVYRGPLDIHPVHDLFLLAPNRGFAEKSRGGKNAVNLDRRWIPHVSVIVIDNGNDAKAEIENLPNYRPDPLASNFSLDKLAEIDYNNA